jgi:tetratricopeptide (TPR) repeat protein
MRLALLMIVCIFSTGCVTTRYVERSSDHTKQKPDSVATNDSIGNIYHGVVVFESSEELKANPLSCLAVFPITAKGGDTDSAVSIRNALHANLAPSGIRLLPLQKIDAAIKANGDLNSAVVKVIGCDTVMVGEVIDDPSSFYGMYSVVRAGANIRIVKVSTGDTLWRGNHTAVLRAGGLPLGFLDVPMNVFSAVRNLTKDQSSRVTNDLARRLILTIPGLAYQAEVLPIEEQPILTAVEVRPPQTAYGLLSGLELAPPEEVKQRLIDELKSNRWNSPKDRVLIAEALIGTYDQQPLGYYEAALARLRLSEPIMALPHAERAATLEPESADSQFLLGRVQLAINKPRDSIKPLLKAVALDGKEIHLNALGTAYNQLGDYPKAAVSFAKVLIKDTDNSYALLHGAIAQAGAGANTEAVRMLRRSMIVGIARSDSSAATRALNILRAMDLANLLHDGELEVLESKIKMLKVS